MALLDDVAKRFGYQPISSQGIPDQVAPTPPPVEQPKTTNVTSVKSFTLPGNPFNSQAFGDFSLLGTDRFSSEGGEMKAYSMLPWVAIAVDSLMRDIGSRPWRFIDGSNKEVDIARVDERIIAPIKRGFAKQNFSSMIKSFCVAQINLTGNMLWWRAPGTEYGRVFGVADRFIPIMPGNFTFKCDHTGFDIEYYEITMRDGTRKKLMPDEVIHFRQNNIYNPFWGVGCIEKMRIMAEGEVSSEEFTKSFMERGAAPSLVITDTGDVLPEERDRTELHLRQSYEGRRNTGRVLYLSGEGVDAKVLTLSQKDIQFMEGKAWNMKTTLACFQVVPEAVGVTDTSNLNVSANQLNRYYEGINAKLVELEEIINSQHVDLFNNGIKLEFKKYFTGDVDRIAKMVQAGLMKPARGQFLLGEDADQNDPATNTFYIPNNYIPIDMAGELAGITGTTGTNSLVGTAVKIHEQMEGDIVADKFLKSAQTPKQFQHKYIRAAYKTRAAVTEKYSRELGKMFEAQGERAKAAFIQKFQKSYDAIGFKAFTDMSAEKIAGLIFDLNFENDELKAVAKKMHTSGIQRAATDLNSLLSTNYVASISNPVIASAVQRLGKQIVGGYMVGTSSKVRIGVNDITLEKLTAVIKTGMDSNATVLEIANSIQDKFGEFAGARSVVIARTESRIAWDATAQILYADMGIDKVDIVGCTEFEPDSDCGAQGVPVKEISLLNFHPQHKGVPAPSLEP